MLSHLMGLTPSSLLGEQFGTIERKSLLKKKKLANNLSSEFAFGSLRDTQVFSLAFLGRGIKVRQKYDSSVSRLSLALNKQERLVDQMWYTPLKEVNQANVSLAVLDNR